LFLIFWFIELNFDRRALGTCKNACVRAVVRAVVCELKIGIEDSIQKKAVYDADSFFDRAAPKERLATVFGSATKRHSKLVYLSAPE
jgi:hypothetical protein